MFVSLTQCTEAPQRLMHLCTFGVKSAISPVLPGKGLVSLSLPLLLVYNVKFTSEAKGDWGGQFETVLLRSFLPAHCRAIPRPRAGSKMKSVCYRPYFTLQCITATIIVYIVIAVTAVLNGRSSGGGV